MIIAIPTNEKSLEAKVSRNLARAGFILFYDAETETANYVDNPAKNASGGAGVTAGQFINDHGATVVITPRCGENAYKVLNGTCKIFKSIEGSIQENIDGFKTNELTVLTEIHKGNHGHA